VNKGTEVFKSELQKAKQEIKNRAIELYREYQACHLVLWKAKLAILDAKKDPQWTMPDKWRNKIKINSDRMDKIWPNLTHEQRTMLKENDKPITI